MVPSQSKRYARKSPAGNFNFMLREWNSLRLDYRFATTDQFTIVASVGEVTGPPSPCRLRKSVHHFAFGILAAQVGELLIADGMSITRYRFRQPYDCLLGRCKVVPPPVSQVPKLIVAPPQGPRQNGVARQAIGRLVQLAGANDDEFL